MVEPGRHRAAVSGSAEDPEQPDAARRHLDRAGCDNARPRWRAGGPLGRDDELLAVGPGSARQVDGDRLLLGWTVITFEQQPD